MRAVAYTRVSDPSQVEGHSLDGQERYFYQFCASKEWPALKVYREEGRSAHSDSLRKRPVLRQLLEDAAQGQFDVVVVHTLDRWYRNLQGMMESVAALNRHGVALVSISENLDWTTPEGRLVARTLGSFAEFFSDVLGVHVKKGVDARAAQGLHLGSIPFGYASCWRYEDGGRMRLCKPEHPGGVHLVADEAQAVSKLFQEYAIGTATTPQQAMWLNGKGFRTRNTKQLPGPDGELVSGPRLFTADSVKVILHNPFYAGLAKHKGEIRPGAHEAIISQEAFDLVQVNLRKNSGRSRTLTPHPEREYLLQGIIRCGYCLMPMWSQTYKSGYRYYREHRASRSIQECPSAGGSIKCEVPDEQMGRIISAIEIGPAWQGQVLAIIQVKDEVERVKEERKKVKERLRRLAQTYNDLLCEEGEYQRKKRQLNQELESLVVPEANAAEAAGKLMQRLPELWEGLTWESGSCC